MQKEKYSIKDDWDWEVTQKEQKMLDQRFIEKIKLSFFKQDQFKDINKNKLKKKGKKIIKAIQKDKNNSINADWWQLERKNIILTLLGDKNGK